MYIKTKNPGINMMLSHIEDLGDALEACVRSGFDFTICSEQNGEEKELFICFPIEDVDPTPLGVELGLFNKPKNDSPDTNGTEETKWVVE